MSRTGACLALVVLMLAGCRGGLGAMPQRPEVARPPGPLPEPADLVAAHNADAARLGRLWARAVVRVRWTDEDGDRQSEQGEGNFIYAAPGNVVLTLGKLGKTLFWAGSNEHRYWLFDLRDEGQAFVGERVNAGRPCAEPLPLGVQPDTLPRLMGLVSLDAAELASAGASVSWDAGYVLRLPDRGLRLVFDPRTRRLVEVAQHDAAGAVLWRAVLSEYEAVEVGGLPPGARPRVATRIEVDASAHDARLTLWLSRPSDAAGTRKIQDRQFDFAQLLGVLKPGSVVDLDAGCR